MSSSVRIAIIGSGPSGLSCAAHAAELNVPHVLLEAEEHLSHTIYRYQKGKHVMAEPRILPLRSPISFAAGKREAILGEWDEEVAKYKVNMASPFRGHFDQRRQRRIRDQDGRRRHAYGRACGPVHRPAGQHPQARRARAKTCRACSTSSTIRANTMAKPSSSSAPAMPASRMRWPWPNTTASSSINRVDEFARAKKGNIDLVTAAIKDGKMECRFSTNASKSTPWKPTAGRYASSRRHPQGAENIAVTVSSRVWARLLRAAGRELRHSDSRTRPGSGAPGQSATYESNVHGLYIIGALGGYPLIKQAMNQGYEVVEYILGNPVEPADETLLKAKFENSRGAKMSTMRFQSFRRNVPLFKDMTTLQLREFMLDSELQAPQAGETIFKRDDYTNSFYSIVDGEVHRVDVPARTARSTVALKQGQFFGELGLISGRRRSAHGHAERQLRTGRNAAALDAEADRERRGGAARRSTNVPPAGGARAYRAGRDRGGSGRDDQRRADQKLSGRRDGSSTRARRATACYLIRARLGHHLAQDRRQGSRALIRRRRQLRRRNGAVVGDAERSATVRAAVDRPRRSC